MSPRQLLRAYEVRSASVPRTLGQQGEQEVRRYPDASGDAPLDDTLDDQFDVVLSRIRLNAGATDWRNPPIPEGTGTGGAQRLVFNEVLDGDRDDENQTFTTAYPFYPQTLCLLFNGLQQAPGADSDYVAQESGGQGTGFDTIRLAYAPSAVDSVTANYTQDDTTAGNG